MRVKMRSLFFNDVKRTKDNKSLLIVILANRVRDNKPEIKMFGLPIIHALSHIRKHNNTSAIILSPDGAILDLADASTMEKVTLVSEQITSSGENYLKSALNQLKDEIQVLSENCKFDLALVIGGEPGELMLTKVAANELLGFNNLHMNNRGVIRIQICNFADKEINGSNIVFAHAITPDFCVCSVPKGFSIIAPQDTRAIDLPNEYDSSLNMLVFDKLKSRIKRILGPKNNKSNEEIINKIKEIEGADISSQSEIVDLSELFEMDLTKNLPLN